MPTGALQAVTASWQRLGPAGRLVAGAAVALAAVAVVAVLALEVRGPRYVALYSQLDPRDAGDIVARLEEQKIPYRLAAGGTTIEVPEPVVYRTRLSLAQSGLPRSGVVGFEIMDKVNFSASEFDKRVSYLRAIQGELTRTIQQIDGVEAARVHLNIPEPSVFVRDKRPASAAILLRLRPGATLEAPQVRGITHLVAGSVEGLRPENVTVLDENGRLLTALLSDAADGGPAASGNLMIQESFQRQMEKSLQTLLEQVLGPGKVVARVTAELNFDRVTEDQELWQPIQNEQGLVRSIQELEESFTGTGAAAGGTPGTDSNIPTYPAGSGGNSEYRRTDRQTSYEINRIRKQITVAPGAVKRLSVSVVVDRNLSQEQQDRIAQLVSTAVGLDTERRDQISVIGLPFDTSALDALKGAEGTEPAPPSPAWRRYTVWAGAGVGALLILLVFFLILQGVRRRAAAEKAKLAAQLMDLQKKAALEAKQRELQEIAEQGALQNQLQTQVATLAKQKPEEVAQIIRSWLSEE